MPSLTAQPTPEETRLLTTVMSGFVEADGTWPVWQWVERRLDGDGIDGAHTLRRMPTWQYFYRSVWKKSGPSGEAADDEPVVLTMHGLTFAEHSLSAQLSRVFLAALAIADEEARAVEPSPTTAMRRVLAGQKVTEAANMRTGAAVSAEQLHGLLEREPATWGGLQQAADTGWQWDVTRPRLSLYRGVADSLDYLSRLEQLVGIPDSPAAVANLPPLAMPEAIDHLDLAWRLITGRRLLGTSRAAAVAKLTQPVASADEFDSRCSALADVFASLDPGGSEQGSLHRLRCRLGELLGHADPARAQEAADVLRNVVAVRASQQHAGGRDGSSRQRPRPAWIGTVRQRLVRRLGATATSHRRRPYRDPRGT